MIYGRCEFAFRWPIVGLVALLAAGLLAPERAWGDDDEEKDSEREVELVVWTVRASKTSDEISRELRPIARELKKRFKYEGFELEKKSTRKVKLDESYESALTEGFRAKVTPKEIDGKRIKLEIEISRKEGKEQKRLLRTTVTLDRSRFHLQGGWRIKDGEEDVLIVAVAAR